MWMQELMKPWYVWRPWQLARRAKALWVVPDSGYTALPVAWGVSVVADPSKLIGRSIWTTGVYDLTVSEILARLIVPGDTVLDAGANVGYMTLLAGVAAGPSGRVLAWEPHPELFSVLQQNVASVARSGKLADVILRNAALGLTAGTADLIVPKDMGSNDGISYIGPQKGPADTVSVKVETIDDVIGTMPISVMKLDVEGFERAVLGGASRALGAGQITHIVFEDHAGADSDVARFLESLGYEVFSIGWSLRGPKLGAYGDGTLAEAYEAPSYVASREPDQVRRRCSTGGWMTLSREFPKRSRVS